MKKKSLLMTLMIFLVLVFIPVLVRASEDETASLVEQVTAENAQSFTLQNTPLMDDNGEIGNMDLRFYTDSPNIAYIGFKAYLIEMQELDVTVTAQEDGTWIITKTNGKTLVADPSTGTLYADDWAGFQTPEPPYIQEKVHIKDTDLEWTELTELVFDDEPTPVIFDFAKYGIAMYADEADVYLPLTVISVMLEDISMPLLAYNGEKLFKYSGDTDNLYSFVPGYYEGGKIRELLEGKIQREEDQIRESYAELCFFVDYFYGNPGPAHLKTAIREKGFDAALDDLENGLGEEIRQLLQSPDYTEYLTGIQLAIDNAISDGHTVFVTVTNLQFLTDLYQNTLQSLVTKISEYPVVSMDAYQQLVKSNLENTRQELWGDETYHEYGSTAIIRLDSFNPDETGWHDWQEGKGEMPMDALGITCRGLEKAAANPDIKNIIFDLTANSGGSQDLMQAVIGMVTDDAVVFSGYNELTKQKMHSLIITDRNMDGVIDEKDKDVSYDYNFGVLVSRSAFSCGNLFPILMQEKGAAVIGENSGGGSCVVQMFTLSDGPIFIMSSYQWHLRNTNGEDVVEYGADPNIPIERIETMDWENPYFPRLVPGDYTPYYNDEMLDQMMNEYFAQTASVEESSAVTETANAGEDVSEGAETPQTAGSTDAESITGNMKSPPPQSISL